MTLRVRFALALAAIAIASVGVTTWMGSRAIARGYRARADRQLEAQAVRLAAGFEAALATKRAQLERLSHGDWRREAVALVAGAGRSPDAARTAATSLADRVGLDVLEIIGPDSVLVSSKHWPANYGASTPHLAGCSTPTWVELGGFDPQARRRLDWALATGTELALGETEPYTMVTAVVVDAAALDGLASTAGTRVGLGGDHWLWSRGSALPVELLAEAPRTPGHLAALHGQTGVVARVATVALPGGPADRPMVLGVAQSEATLNRALADQRRALWPVALATGLGSMALGALLARRMTQPLERTARAARQVAAGNLTVELPAGGGAEHQALADAFNQMTRDLRRDRERLVQAERVAAWREVAHKIAHEIANVLSPIGLAVDAIGRVARQRPDELERTIESSNQIVTAEIARLGRLVREFKTFAREPSLRPRPMDVAALVDDVVALERESVAQLAHGAELVADVSPTAGIATLDADAMRGALINLIQNAALALSEAGAGRIVVAAEGRAHDIDLIVRDNGPGFPAELRGRLLTPYVTTRPEGSGLGLAIVLRTAIEHGGDVQLVDGLDGGAGVRLRLPRQPTSVS